MRIIQVFVNVDSVFIFKILREVSGLGVKKVLFSFLNTYCGQPTNS